MELFKLIAQGCGSQMCYKIITERFGSDPQFIPFSRRTLQSYMTQNKAVPQIQPIPSTPTESIDQINYQNLVLSQFESFTERLIQMQSTSDKSDPEFMAELIRIQKEWRSFFELVQKLKSEKEDQDVDVDLERLLARNEYYLMTAAEGAYLETNGRENIGFFNINLTKHLKKQTDNFKKTLAAKGGK